MAITLYNDKFVANGSPALDFDENGDISKSIE